MNPYLTILPALAAVVIDLSFAPQVSFFGARPSLTLVLVGLWSALRPRAEVMVMAPAAGVFLGLLGNEPLGASIIAITPFVLLGSIDRPAPNERRFASSIGVVMAGTLLYGLLYAIFARLMGAPAPLSFGAIRLLAVAALLNGVLAVVLYWPLARTAPPEPARGSLRH